MVKRESNIYIKYKTNCCVLTILKGVFTNISVPLLRLQFQPVGFKQRTIERIDGNFYKEDHYYACPPLVGVYNLIKISFSFL